MILLFAQIEFAYPTRLIALAAVPVFMYIALRGRRLAIFELAKVGVRALIVGLLILAVAGLSSQRVVEQSYTVFVADVSQSAFEAQAKAQSFIDAARKQAGDRSSRVLAFAGTSEWLDSGKLRDAKQTDRLTSDATSALLLAEATAPADLGAEIVLLTDGNSNAGGFAATAHVLRRPVNVIPLTPFAENEVCLLDIVVPTQGGGRSKTEFDISILANSPAMGTLRLSLNGKPLAAAELSIDAGHTQHRLRLDIDRTKTAVVAAALEGFDDTLSENNQRSTLLPAIEPLQAVVVADKVSTTESLSAALVRNGFEVKPALPQQLPRDANRLAPFDLVVLADVAPREFDQQAIEALRHYVKSGGGLIAAGSQRTFGVEELAGTDLEAILPVKSSPREVEKKASLALVMVIDKSTSMLTDDRLKLAKVAAKQTVDSLSEEDKVGVIAFGTDIEWVSEIYPCSDKPELRKRIDMLTANGQTDMYPALEKAYVALEQADADRRHAIVLTDGVSTPGDFGKVARRMAESGITVSTVSVSPGAEQAILKDIAQLAGGRHYHCDDAADIAAILIGDTKRVESDQLEYEPVEHLRLPWITLTGAPALTGYTPTSPQPQSELLLRTAGGDPLLAWRRYGAGVTVAFTSQVESGWAARWKNWAGFDEFWSHLARHASRSLQPHFSLHVERRGIHATALLDVVDDTGEFADGLSPQASVFRYDSQGNPSANAVSLAMQQVAPGRYAAEFAARERGVYAVEVAFADTAGTQQKATAGLGVDYPDELRLQPLNDAALRALAATTGGKYDPQPGKLFGDGGRMTVPVPLWHYLLIAAALVLVVDVALRRSSFMFGKP